MTIWLKDKYQILAYHVNNTYAKLAPDSILNKKIKEIMRYTGGHRTSPLPLKLQLIQIPLQKLGRNSLY